MTHYQPLETEKYWNDVLKNEALRETSKRNRSAMEAFVIFTVGVALIAACNYLFYYWCA